MLTVSDLKFTPAGKISKKSKIVLEQLDLKWCPTCSTIKSLSSDFGHPPSYHGAPAGICKECRADIDAKRGTTDHGRFVLARSAAAGSGHEWTLTLEQYIPLIRQCCCYCELPLNSTKIGLDRIDNADEYNIGNVVPCCIECNIARHDLFTYQEMKLYIGPAIRAAKLARIK